jgi:hypothetical protein
MFGPGGVDLRGGQGFPPWAVFGKKPKNGYDKTASARFSQFSPKSDAVL